MQTVCVELILTDYLDYLGLISEIPDSDSGLGNEPGFFFCDRRRLEGER